MEHQVQFTLQLPRSSVTVAEHNRRVEYLKGARRGQVRHGCSAKGVTLVSPKAISKVRASCAKQSSSACSGMPCADARSCPLPLFAWRSADADPGSTTNDSSRLRPAPPADAAVHASPVHCLCK